MKLYWILFLYPAITFAVKYIAEIGTSNPFIPCEDKPDLYLLSFLDLDNVTFRIFDNNTLLMRGSLGIHKYLDDIIGLKMEVYKKQRGVYVNTIFSIYREDICRSFFNPIEYWYPVVKDVPQEQHKCPYQRGMVFDLDVLSELILDLHEKSAEGCYKIRCEFFYQKSRKVIACFEIFGCLYRL